VLPAVTRVAALVRLDAAHPALASETLQALLRQTRLPEVILIAVEAGEWAPDGAELVRVAAGAGPTRAGVAGIRAALERGAEWIWLLDGVTVPERPALATLLASTTGDEELPVPRVVASRVVTTDGRPHPDSLPRHELFEKQVSVAAVERGLVHLRSVRHGSLLVSRGAVERFGSPRAEFTDGDDALEWTTRILRSWNDPGYLATDSVAVRRVPSEPFDGSRRRRDFGNRRRMLLGDAWSPTERLWYTYLLGFDLVATMAGRAPARRV